MKSKLSELLPGDQFRRPEFGNKVYTMLSINPTYDIVENGYNGTDPIGLKYNYAYFGENYILCVETDDVEVEYILD